MLIVRWLVFNFLAVRRSTSNHNDLTEPIVVLAKQVASKEVEIDRLKSQLNRRSSRADSQRAQFEDELAAQRREADYNREQASKLKTKWKFIYNANKRIIKFILGFAKLKRSAPRPKPRRKNWKRNWRPWLRPMSKGSKQWYGTRIFDVKLNRLHI